MGIEHEPASSSPGSHTNHSISCKTLTHALLALVVAGTACAANYHGKKGLI